MEHKETVRKFVDALGKFEVPKIDAKLVETYITNIVIDTDSLEEFICYSDRYLKHTQTFQLAFLLHSLASVLVSSPMGSAVLQVTKDVNTDAFDIPTTEGLRLRELDEAKRYEGFCDLLMDYESAPAQSLEKRIQEQRTSGDNKLDDGSEPNAVFNPYGTKLPQNSAGEDLTEETEIID